MDRRRFGAPAGGRQSLRNPARGIARDAAAIGRHQEVAARLFVNLANWCRANTGWRYRSPGGVYISEATWLKPGIAMYSVLEYLQQDWREMPPPLMVVEVLSPSTKSVIVIASGPRILPMV